MNDTTTKEMFENIVSRVVEKKLGEITRKTQGILASGTITSIDYNGFTATVEIIGGGSTGNIPYPKCYTNTQIGVGQRVLIGGTDPQNFNSMFIIGAYGNF